ncbi:cysteine hydrolase [Alicyclobacillus curvatus]|nr:cysteine hydrolase [Alicyclobacillus curvatus]
MDKALIVVDYTFDFIADEGRLTCGRPGQEIDAYIAKQIEAFVEANEIVVFAVDVHEEGDLFHPETKLFPPHNIRGTSGRDLFGQVGQVFAKLTADGLPHNVRYLDKTRYSAFAGTDLEIFLRSHGVNEVHLVGVCTDICVLHTAVDAYNKGFHVVIHEAGVASFSEVGHTFALGHFKDVIGAHIIGK